MNISDVMTRDPVTLDATSTAVEAARLMKQRDIGDVLVCQGDQVCGIVTDRDIVIRAVAEDKNLSNVFLSDICSSDVTTVAPTDSISDAVRLMSDRALRRIPVVENGRPVGIVTLGDLAVEKEPDSVLADISEAPPDD